jgi:hypothetical protein
LIGVRWISCCNFRTSSTKRSDYCKWVQ